MENTLALDPGHLVTYTVVYPIMAVIGLVANSVSIAILSRPALRSLPVRGYYQLLMWTDLLLYLYILPLALSDGGCTFHQRWFAEYFAHMGWALFEVFQAFSAYIVNWLALDRCLAVWWFTGYNFIRRPLVQKLRAIITAGFCFVLFIPYIIDGEAMCISWNGTLSTDDPNCLNGTWAVNKRNFRKEWQGTYRGLVVGAIVWVPGALLLFSSVSLVAAVLMGRVRSGNKTTTRQEVQTRSEEEQKRKLAITQNNAELTETKDEEKAKTSSAWKEQRNMQGEIEEQNTECVTDRYSKKERTTDLGGLDDKRNEELVRAAGGATIFQEETVQDNSFNEQQEGGKDHKLSGIMEGHPRAPSKAEKLLQEVPAETGERQQEAQLESSKGWQEALNKTWERNIVITMIAMATSYLILTTPYVAYIMNYANKKEEYCLVSKYHPTLGHVGICLRLLENLLHPVFLACLNPKFKKELHFILLQVGSRGKALFHTSTLEDTGTMDIEASINKSSQSQSHAGHNHSK